MTSMAQMTVESRAERTGPRSRWRRVLLLAVVGVGLIACGWKLEQNRRYRRAMAEIKREIQAGRNSHAARKLVALSAWKPDSDEAAYLLGVCEKARGQTQAAFGAWDRVSPGSSFSAQAIQGRMQLLIERGRLADAEKLIIRAMADPRDDASKLGPFLGLVYSLQDRIEDRQRVIEACWDRLNKAGEGASERATLLVRLHIQTPTTEETRSFLDQAARSAPQDDRVWLGKAKLAIGAGMYDEAARWLEACLRRRPDDIPVWHARLDWALATDRHAEVRQALAHLPVEDSTPALLLRVTAWLAANAGDRGSERRALERLIVVDPADFPTLDRLVVIAQKEGKADRADELRRKKIKVDQLLARYGKLYKRNQTIRDAPEMASLAEQLGQPFEAKVFLTIAIANELEQRQFLRDQLVLASQDVSTTHSPGRNLADVLATELDAADRATIR